MDAKYEQFKKMSRQNELQHTMINFLSIIHYTNFYMKRHFSGTTSPTAAVARSV
jgi:hypothetical protein